MSRSDLDSPGANEQPPIIESIHIRNYRLLRDVQLDDLSPMTVLIGPNGSGKSTLFDVFAFLSECFTDGLWRACANRGGLAEIRSRGTTGPISIELTYREARRAPGKKTGGGLLLRYRLELDERDRRPYAARELLQWKDNPGRGRPRDILKFVNGRGTVTLRADNVRRESLADPDALAVQTLGALKTHRRVTELRRFVSGWHLSYLSPEAGRGLPASGPQERLTRSGDNLGNVIQYLEQRHPNRLRDVLRTLSETVPGLDRVEPETTIDGRLVLKFTDHSFDQPVIARWVSDGTLKMLAYLVMLSDPTPPLFIGIEEPENFLYHSLLSGLARTCRQAADRSQILVTTHSYDFLDECLPEEVFAIFRGADGYARVKAAAKDRELRDMVEIRGGQLGWLVQHDYFADLPMPRTRGELLEP